MIAGTGNTWYDEIIKYVERGKITHIAGLLLNSTFEALGVKEGSDKYAGTWLHSPTKYKDGNDCEFITLRIKDLSVVEERARNLLGTPYSFHGCVSAGLLMKFNLKTPVDGSLTTMCAENYNIILANQLIDCNLPDFKPDFVAPQRFYDAIIGGKQNY